MQHVTLASVQQSCCLRFRHNVLTLPRRLPYTRKHSGITFDPNSHPIAKSEDGSRTLRVRGHGHKHLPLPTILDPVAIEARTKFEKPKERTNPGESDNLTPFQRELDVNVYARALATPIRQCVVTKARLPSQLLVPFVENLIVPDGRGGASRPARPMFVPGVTFKTHSPMAQVHCSRELVSQMPGKKGRWVSLVSERMKQRQALRTQKSVDKVKVNEWQLRDGDDIAQVVQDRLGSNVVTALGWCLRSGEQIVIPPSDRMPDHNAACILHTHKDLECVDARFEDLQHYNLARMLSGAQLKQMQELFGGENHVMMILKHPSGVILQLALRRLEQYLGNCTTEVEIGN